MSEEAPPSFEHAIEELESILDDMETGVLPIDELAASVERASELIRACRGILTATEARVAVALSSLSDAEP